MRAATAGAATSDSANIRPMLAPTSAMALVRTSSRVWSASSAVTAADTAPAPCSERPTISQVRSPAAAATKLPAANTARPATITRLRPNRSRGQAERNLQDALREAVDAHGQPDERGVGAARVAGSLQREHGQDQEQPEHAGGEDGGERRTGAALCRGHAAGRGGVGRRVQGWGQLRNAGGTRPGKIADCPGCAGRPRAGARHGRAPSLGMPAVDPAGPRPSPAILARTGGAWPSWRSGPILARFMHPCSRSRTHASTQPRYAMAAGMRLLARTRNAGDRSTPADSWARRSSFLIQR